MLYAVLLSCTAVDDVSRQTATTQEPLDLVLSVGNTGDVTRQGVDVVQDEGQNYRGLNKLILIPFITDGPVTADDMPQIPVTLGDEAQKVTGQNYYYWNQCLMLFGTNHVLAYGRAATVSGKESNTQNGVLETAMDGRMKPSDITFNVKAICESTDPIKAAKDLADYMTFIAQAPGWSTSTDAQMKAIYLDFIREGAEGTGIMCGSAAHIDAYVNDLKELLTGIKDATGTSDDTKTLCADIILRINNAEMSACLTNEYPSGLNSLGLPDGAAAIRWLNNAFQVRTMTTTLDNINGINRYAYPAELWYYANSSLRTSDSKVEKSTYENTATWSTLLNNNYKGGNSIGMYTQSAAVEQPLQYGVGRLQMTLDAIPIMLKDSKGEEIKNQGAQNLPLAMPLTSVIIGAQHTVGFDFRPRGEQSNVDARFIYDKVVGGKSNDGTWTVNTLVLQTYDNEKVPVVLEFKNETGVQFHGKDGIVYPNTKFYMVAELDPADGEGEGDAKNRIFTQDHTTKVKMKVTSLANAYSCMPDLLSPRLEIGVKVTTKWIQSTTTTVKL